MLATDILLRQSDNIGRVVTEQGRNIFVRAQLNGCGRFIGYRFSLERPDFTFDFAFFQRNGQWIDSRLVNGDNRPSRTIEFGSDEFQRLLRRLVNEGRQGTVSLRGDVLLPVTETSEGAAVIGRPVVINPAAFLYAAAWACTESSR